MAFAINRFKSALTGGGARPTLFQVNITNPIAPLADIKIPLMVKAASLPTSSTGQYFVPYFGRQIWYGGDRVFDEWNVTVINDEDFQIRNAMEAWSNSINSHISNDRALPQEYKSDAQVTQFSKDQKVLRQITFQGLFPTIISDIPLAWETTDSIEEFTVSFRYDVWKVTGGTTGRSTS